MAYPQPPASSVPAVPTITPRSPPPKNLTFNLKELRGTYLSSAHNLYETIIVGAAIFHTPEPPQQVYQARPATSTQQSPAARLQPSPPATTNGSSTLRANAPAWQPSDETLAQKLSRLHVEAQARTPPWGAHPYPPAPNSMPKSILKNGSGYQKALAAATRPYPGPYPPAPNSMPKSILKNGSAHQNVAATPKYVPIPVPKSILKGTSQYQSQRKQEPPPRILLVKYATAQPANWNLFELPGGRMVPQDLTIPGALVRRVKEITGLDAIKVVGEVGGGLELLYMTRNANMVGEIRMLQVSFVVDVKEEGILTMGRGPAMGTEVAEYCWAEEWELCRVPMAAEMRKMVKEAFKVRKERHV